MSFRKIFSTTVNNGKQAKVIRDTDWEQYIVVTGDVDANGKVIWNMASQYHTDAKYDAISTALVMVGLPAELG